MSKIKAINDVSDLIAVFHASDSEVKRNVFSELSKGWVTEEDIKNKYGEEGLKSLKYFERIKFVETQWTLTKDGKRSIAYRTYYDTVQVNITVPISDMPEIIYASTMPDEKVKEYENRILEIMGSRKSIFIGDVQNALGISMILLKGIIKRSEFLDIKGHNIERD
ncbi:MAG: ArsR family transcriptional regulator [Thermoplasmata archaeon]